MAHYFKCVWRFQNEFCIQKFQICDLRHIFFFIFASKIRSNFSINLNIGKILAIFRIFTLKYQMAYYFKRVWRFQNEFCIQKFHICDLLTSIIIIITYHFYKRQFWLCFELRVIRKIPIHVKLHQQN
jgi:hypothetical protein